MLVSFFLNFNEKSTFAYVCYSRNGTPNSGGKIFPSAGAWRYVMSRLVCTKMYICVDSCVFIFFRWFNPHIKTKTLIKRNNANGGY